MSPAAFLFVLEGVLGVVGAAGMALLGLPAVARPDPLRDTLAFLLVYLLLAGLEAAFARLFPDSYRAAEALVRAAVRALPEGALLPLAGVSALAEEVFFRGLVVGGLARPLDPVLAVVLGALVFALFHPVPDRRAWAYGVFVFLAGLLLGAAYLATGSLVPGVLAHYLTNARALLEAKGPPSPRGRYLG